MSPQNDGDGLGFLLVAGAAYLIWSAARPAQAGNGLGRNMTEAEATGLDMARVLQTPVTLETARRLGRRGRIPVQEISPPWVEKSAGSQPYMEQNTAGLTLPALGTEATVLTFTVPRRKNGLIDRIANQFIGGGWTEGSGDLVWRVEADGVPIQGYHNMISSIGTMTNPADLGQSTLAIYENQVIRLVARNVAVPVAGQILLGMFRGRFYPIEQEGQNTWL